ncbi:MAG: hypothetical protein LBI56_04215 [Puniceicoccales bacterium]|jgi:hypothetical protein|nr:hypothetical protein [Puniceicoccales bacterium]
MVANLSIDEFAIMLGSAVAIWFVDASPMGECTGKFSEIDGVQAKIRKSQRNQRLIQLGIFAMYYVVNDLHNFIGSLALLGSILLLTYGYGDSRYVAMKFAAYHLLALVLCACASILPIGVQTAILHMAAFGILTATYPMSGWIEPFFARAPFFLISTWLIFIRPIEIKFLLATAPWGLVPSSRATFSLALVMIFGSLGFVPILFFAKAELRKLIAYAACWQSGYIWLFAIQFAAEKSNSIIPFATVQGIFLALVARIATTLYSRNKTDSITNLGGLFEANYFAAVFLVSSLVFLLIMPVIFLVKKNIYQMPSLFIFQVCGSMILPALFGYKIYLLLQKNGTGEQLSKA